MQPYHEPRRLSLNAAPSIQVCPGHQLLIKQEPAKLFLNALNSKARHQAVPGHASQLTADRRAAKSKHDRHQMGRCRLRLLNLSHLRPRPTALRPVDDRSKDLCVPSLHLRRPHHQKTIGIALILAIPLVSRLHKPISPPTIRHLLLDPPSVPYQLNNTNRSPLYKRTSTIPLATAQSGPAER